MASACTTDACINDLQRYNGSQKWGIAAASLLQSLSERARSLEFTNVAAIKQSNTTLPSSGYLSISSLYKAASSEVLLQESTSSRHSVLAVALFLAMCILGIAFGCKLLAEAGGDDTSSTRRQASPSKPAGQLHPHQLHGAGARGLDRSDKNPNAHVMFLCPELIVPVGQECVNIVQLPMGLDLGTLTSSILDERGTKVMTAVIRRPALWCRMSAMRLHNAMSPFTPMLSIRMHDPSTGRDKVVAHCYASSTPEHGSKQVRIYNPACDFIGHVAKDEQPTYKYVYRGAAEVSGYNFEGSFADHSISACHIDGSVAAHCHSHSMPINPDGKYYRVVTSEKTEVAIILCSLLAIGELELEAAENKEHKPPKKKLAC